MVTVLLVILQKYSLEQIKKKKKLCKTNKSQIRNQESKQIRKVKGLRLWSIKKN